MVALSKIWAEAWSLPDDPVFEKKIGPILHQGLTYERSFRDFGGGNFTLAAKSTRHAQICDPSNNLETLIRVFEAGVNVHSFYARSLTKDFTPNGGINISGPGIKDSFEKVIMYPFDWQDTDSGPGAKTTGTTKFSDTIYGGENILENGDLEGAVLPEVQAIAHDHTGGTFTLSYGAETTGTLNWDATADQVEIALKNLNALNLVDVSGDGKYGSPWRVEFFDPPYTNVQTLVLNSSLTGGTIFEVQIWREGGYPPMDPWVRSFNPMTGLEHGIYDTFRTGSAAVGDPTHSGNGAIGINPNEAANFAGAQQTVSVTPGGLYQASVWVLSRVPNREFALVIRDKTETLISKTTILAALADTWYQIVLENVVIPQHNIEVVFRVASITPGNTDSFWIDDAEFNEGLKPQSVGQIVQNMFVTAAFEDRDVLLWLDHTSFDGTVDSNGNPWTHEFLKVVLSMGMTWAQVMEIFEDKGYEWDINWDDGLQQYRLYLFNEGGLGTFITANFPKLSTMRSVVAQVAKSTPRASYVLGQGDAGLVDESADIVLEAAYGRRESFVTDTDATDLITLEASANFNLQRYDAEKVGAKFGVDSSIRLGKTLDLDIGDTVPVHLPGDIAPTTMRVFGYQVSLDPQLNASKTIDVGKHIRRERPGGTTSSPTSAGLNYLLRQFKRIQKRTVGGVPTQAAVPVIPEQISAPAYFTVPTGGVFPAESSSDIFWELISDPDGICQPLVPGEEDFIKFTEPGLYLVDYQIHGEWDTTDAGWSNWEILSDVWNNGGPVGPWQGDQIYTENSSGGSTAYLYVHGTHLIEIVDIAEDTYILMYDFFEGSP